MRKSAKATLLRLLRELKSDAFRLGRYEGAPSAEAFDNRKGRPFRCIAYNDAVRRINALSRLLAEVGGAAHNE